MTTGRPDTRTEGLHLVRAEVLASDVRMMPQQSRESLVVVGNAAERRDVFLGVASDVIGSGRGLLHVDGRVKLRSMQR